MLGELTERMIKDYSPYLKDPEQFRREVEEDVRESGDVVRIEDEIAVDGSGAVIGRSYYFADGTDYYLTNVHAGVDSL